MRKILLILCVAIAVSNGLTDSWAQGLRITRTLREASGELAIEYASDTTRTFRLLQGTNVSSISTPVATNVVYATSGRFLRALPSLGFPDPKAAIFYRIEGIDPDPATVPITTLASSPADGEADVSVNRETILRFSNPLAANTTIGNDILFASYGGRKLLSRVELASEKRTAILFYLEPIPASARIRVTFNGDKVKDFLGRPVDADNDGMPGGIAQLDFDTLSNTPVGTTAMMGRVFASELVPDAKGTSNTVNRPLAGVTITVDGAEQELRAVTDALGNFKLQPCPAGKFFVHIDGRTAPLSQWPNGGYYPFVGKQWEATAGRENNLAGGTGEIFLPYIIAGTLRTLSATNDTTITFPTSVISNNPALAGVSLTVPANALFSDDGKRGGKVGIAPVSPDRLPGPLPPGLQFPLVITVQTDGGNNFDRPAPVRFPNLPDQITGSKLPPQTKSALWSFNHDTGTWEIVGTMTVTADGLFVETDAGVGIRQPGWHGVSPAGDNARCKPKPPREKVNIWDAIKQAWDCAKGFIPIKEGIRCGVELVIVLSDQARFINNVVSTLTSEPTADTCVLGRLALSELEKTKEAIDRLSICFEIADPINKTESAISCLQLILSLGQTLCGDTSSGKESGPCAQSWLVRWACIGMDVVQSLLSQAKSMLLEIKNILTNLKANPLDALIEALRLLVEESCNKPASAAGGARIAGQLTDASREEVLKVLRRVEASFAPFENLKDRLGVFEKLLQNIEVQSDDLLRRGNALEDDTLRPPFYAAIALGDVVIRVKSEADGSLRQILRPGVPYTISEYHPSAKMYGRSLGVSAAVGSRGQLVEPELVYDDTLDDSDGDGLSDFAEYVVGTDPAKADTDGDGINDSPEIANGTDPLDGLAVATGIIAATDTPGTAIDVCAINNMVITADAEAGVTVFNVLAGLNPVRVAQVDTAGTALAVACSGGWIAVADGEAGLALVDVSDPPAARMVRQIAVSELGGGSAQAVASAANLAFVGTTQGMVSMVDVEAGVVLQRLDLGSPVNDLTVEGTTLYVYTGTTLHVLPFRLGPMERRGSVKIPSAGGLIRPRIFVGNDMAYVVHSSVSRGGYHTFDVSKPDAPVLIAEGSTAQLSWIQVVPTGTGKALAVRGVNTSLDATSDVSLYDTSDPRKNDVFLTTFSTPGFARATAIYDGLGYVADDKQGLQVLNYLAYDNKKRPPTGTLKIFSVEDNAVTGGAFVVLRAEVADDVQVRSVEFFVGGKRITLDGNFPFETVYRIPTNALGTNLTFSIGIVDTGGNGTSITNAPIAVVLDNQPPGIVFDRPASGQLFHVGDDITIHLTAIDNVGIDHIAFRLNNVPVAVRRLNLSEWQLELPDLIIGTNTLVAMATDLAGLSTVSEPVAFIVLKEAISREISLFNFGPQDVPSAVSREISLFNSGPQDVPNVVSREISVFNFGPLDQSQAISREVSVENQKVAVAPAPSRGVAASEASASRTESKIGN